MQKWFFPVSLIRKNNWISSVCNKSQKMRTKPKHCPWLSYLQGTTIVTNKFNSVLHFLRQVDAWMIIFFRQQFAVTCWNYNFKGILGEADWFLVRQQLIEASTVNELCHLSNRPESRPFFQEEAAINYYINLLTYV